MAGLFGGNKGTPATRYQFLNVQTSAQGLYIPLLWGEARLAPNLIWYGDFVSTPAKQKTGKGGPTVTSYNYSCAVAMALCEGPVQGIGQVWQDQNVLTLSEVGFTLFTGTQTQTPWSFLETSYPAQALAYAGTAYVANAAVQLGTSPDLPNYNYETIGYLSGTMPGTVDANFADIIEDYLTNPQYGLGFPSSYIDSVSLALMKTYTTAQGIFVSPYLSNQEQATQTFQRWAQLANTWIFWSGDLLKFVPLGDTAITANGVTYTPNLTPIYNLTYDNFVFKKGTDPIIVTRSDPADGYNNVTIDCNDRLNAYNNSSVYWQDQSSVALYGQLMSQTISAQEIQSLPVASICATLIGQRSVYIRNTYSFNLGYNFVLLEPGDIVTLTDPNIGLAAFPVRIQSISEGKDGVLKVIAEELPAGIGTPAAYSVQAWSGNTIVNTMEPPGNVNAPAIFEPSAQLTGGVPQVWIAASGGANWGGCDVYISFDGTDYSYEGTISEGSIQGVLTATLPNNADPDTTDTLAVDLTESLSTLPATATHADADAYRTLVLVDSEIMAYGSAVPAGGGNAYAFNLTYLRRGLYQTSPASHSSGANFTRVNQSTIFKYSLPQAYVGQTVYLKFVSFNTFGNAYQSLSAVTEYTYTPVGTAYTIAAPGTPTVAPSSETQSDGTTFLTMTASWTASAGPNLGYYLVQYSTNGGSTWQSAGTVGAGTLSLSLTPAIPSTNYLFRVQAVSQNGIAMSTWATSASTNSGSLVTSTPAAPTGIAASGATNGALVTWTPSSSASAKGYQVSYGTTNVFSSATLYDVTTSGTGLMVTGLAAGTLYYFWVQAFNGAGASSPDGPVSATPTAAGGSATYQQGTLSANGTLTIGSELTLQGTANPTLSFGGLVAMDGATSLGAFLTLEVGANLTGALSSGTFSLSGTSGGGACSPLVNGDLPGPGIMADPLGQCIVVEL